MGTALTVYGYIYIYIQMLKPGSSSMSCVFLHNNLKTRSVLISSMNSKDTCANHVRPHASTGMRPRIPNLEFMRTRVFLK